MDKKNYSVSIPLHVNLTIDVSGESKEQVLDVIWKALKGDNRCFNKFIAQGITEPWNHIFYERDITILTDDVDTAEYYVDENGELREVNDE